jgi:beta-glucosidase
MTYLKDYPKFGSQEFIDVAYNQQAAESITLLKKTQTLFYLIKAKNISYRADCK